MTELLVNQFLPLFYMLALLPVILHIGNLFRFILGVIKGLLPDDDE